MGLTSSSSCISSAQEYIEPLYKNGGDKSIGTPLTNSHFSKASKVADYQSNTATPIFPSPCPPASHPSLVPLEAASDEGAVTDTMEKLPQQRPRTFTMDSSDEVSISLSPYTL